MRVPPPGGSPTCCCAAALRGSSPSTSATASWTGGSELIHALIPGIIGGKVDLIVADLSFISLGLVLPALIGCAAAGADIVPMVKPQFEVGRDRLGAGGVVRDPALRAEAVLGVVTAAGLLGWGLAGVIASPLPGPSGNVEFFVHLRRDAPVDDRGAERSRRMIDVAVKEGPA